MTAFIRHFWIALAIAAMLFSVRTRAADDPHVMPSSDPTLQSPQGAQIYSARCAACHDHPHDRVPPKIFIATLRTPEEIVDILSRGAMRAQAAGLSGEEVNAVAIYLTGHAPTPSTWNPQANPCARDDAAPAMSGGDWNGWGRNDGNSRFQPEPGIEAADVPRLRLRWSFAYPGRAAFGQPVVVGDKLYSGGGGSYFVALNVRSGCTYWSHEVGAMARTAAVVGSVQRTDGRRDVVFFGDDKGRVHALDAGTGSDLWTSQVDAHPIARVLGTPKLFAGLLYVPVTSMEEVAAANPEYPCCRFRGSIVALDAATGRILWQHYSVKDPPKLLGSGPRYGPAGGGIFSSPTLDAGRGLLYVGTGDSYTSLGSDSTDAIIAVDMRAGRRRWTAQVLKDDNFIVQCAGHSEGNCPSPLGPDFDFSSSPILTQVPSGRQLLVAGSKSGIVYGFDVEHNGRLLWKTAPLARGMIHGAILWGMAADADSIYVATSEYDVATGAGPGALVALDAAGGAVRWRTAAPEVTCAWGALNCAHAQIAAVSAMPGIVFSGAMDGRVRAYSSTDGRIVWEFDTSQSFDAVNGGKAKGGAIDYGGQIIARGMLLVHSGSARQPGNALLGFSVDGR